MRGLIRHLEARRNGHHRNGRKTLARYSTTPARLVTPGNVHEASATAFSCIRVLVGAAASLPLHVYRRRVDDSRERVEGRTAELFRRPAPGATSSTLIGEVMTSLQTHGNAFVGKYRDGGRVEQLAVLRPDRVTPELRAGEPVYWYVDEGGKRRELTVRDVVHIRSPMATDGLTGVSPVRACRLALRLDRTLAVFAVNYFQNHARPDGLLRLPPETDDDELEGIKEELAAEAGPETAGRIAVFAGGEGEIDFTPIALPADDSQFLEQRQLSAQEVCRIFGVPPWLVGVPTSDSLTYSNTEQQSLQFVTHALRPWLVSIEQALSADRDLFNRSTYCEFVIDGLLRADAMTRARVYEMALGTDKKPGWMDRDEVRRLENLDPEREES